MSKEHVYKSDSRSQQEIFVSGERFTLPYSLKDDQEFNPIVSYLDEEDRWQVNDQGDWTRDLDYGDYECDGKPQQT